MEEKRDLKDIRYIEPPNLPSLVNKPNIGAHWRHKVLVLSALYFSSNTSTVLYLYSVYRYYIYNYRTVFPFTSIDAMNE